MLVLMSRIVNGTPYIPTAEAGGFTAGFVKKEVFAKLDGVCKPCATGRRLALVFIRTTTNEIPPPIR